MRATILATLVTLVAGTVSAKPPLRDVAEIDGTILVVGIADEIRNQCPTISARMFRAIRLVNGLQARARELGYSDAEIDAYRSSDTEKTRLKGERRAYLMRAGVHLEDPQSYCAVGQAEIEKGSHIGSLLRMN